jgi:curli biogenesis system outer membrane secretion channel CsgG
MEIHRSSTIEESKLHYLRFYGRFVFILFFLLLLGCQGPMSYLHPSTDFSYIKRVAITPIVNLTNDKFAGDKVMNVVATEILRRGVFDVVEFGEVARVLREEGLKDDKLVSKNIAARVGKRLNIEAMIIGSVMEYGVSRVGGSPLPEVSIALKLVDVNSYTILWEATHNVKGTNILDQLFGIRRESPEDLCREVVEEIFDTLFG